MKIEKHETEIGINSDIEEYLADNVGCHEDESGIKYIEFQSFDGITPFIQDIVKSYHKEKMREVLIEFCEQLKDYTSESRTILGHDEREASEFVDIYLNSIKGESDE